MSPIFKQKKKLTKKNLFCPCWSWLKHDCWNLWASNACFAFAVSWGRISHAWVERAELLPVGQDSDPSFSQSCCAALADNCLGALCWQMGFGQMWSQMWSLQIADVSTETGSHQPCLSKVLWSLLGTSSLVWAQQFVLCRRVAHARVVKAALFSCCLAGG